MMSFMKRTVAVIMLVIMIIAMVGCGNKNKTKYDNYSAGLDDNGYYEKFDTYEVKLPNFKDMSFEAKDIIQTTVDAMNDAAADETKKMTVEDYVYDYGRELLVTLSLADKEIVEEDDHVVVSLKFMKDGKQMESFGTENSRYQAKKDSDSIISSFIGHKTNDKYTVDYTFPADDQTYPNQTVQVEVTILSINYSDPIANGVVEANIETIQKYIPNAKDKASFISELYPIIADALAREYVEIIIQEQKDFDPPKETVEYEVYRLKYRLNQVGYTYEQYLEASGLTDEVIQEYCKLVARENLICMEVFKTMDIELTNDLLVQYYGDNFSYLTEMQGLPYLKLELIREYALSEIADMIKITVDGKEVDRTAFDVALELPEDESESETEPTEDTSTVPEDTSTTPTEEQTQNTEPAAEATN